jgi:hypothetical protein
MTDRSRLEFQDPSGDWNSEIYARLVFCLDHVPDLVKARPELKNREPFKPVLAGNREAIAKLSMREFFPLRWRKRSTTRPKRGWM